MAEMLSPLAPVYDAGRHGNRANGPGVTLSEEQPGSIVQVAAWPGQDAACLAGIGKIAKGSAFGFAPRRWLVISDDAGLAKKLSALIGDELGTVTDLSHGRSVLRVSGPKAEWTLAKLFAIDFASAAFPVGHAVSTNHHEIFAQIQRSGPDQFDLYVFRSFARSFWATLRHAAEESGYEIA